MTQFTTETHPLPPFLPKKTQVLLLGSFPPPRVKWKMDFYYPNFQNDMWRIFGLVFFRDKDYFLTEDKKSFDKERLVQFLSQKGIAVYDTAQEVIRHKGNASDNFLEIVTPSNIPNILEQIPLCHTLVTTGDKATETLRSLLANDIKKPLIGGFENIVFNGKTYRFYRMPSSSRAYPKPLCEKAEVYEKLFREIDLF